MLRISSLFASATIALSGSALCHAQWVTFINETSTRMPVGAGLNTAVTSTQDPKEKDYAWGDVDQDGDIDLVCVRKQPFTTTGRDPNVLFMNEGIAEGHSINGVFVDRTAQYASATLETATWDDPQRPGGALPDEGFLTWTNDRDVALADVDNDGWLDIITATTLSEGAPKWIGHPRVYMNLRENKGVWLGFRHEPNRIPQMHPTPTVQPDFCSVSAGDVTGDGYPDLYFADYPGDGPRYNNKLLINQGAANPGFFTDTGTTRISAMALSSSFGASSVIADMNNDGAVDAIRQDNGTVGVHHNNPANVGFFPDAVFDTYTADVYFMSAGDLNNDGRLDMIFTKDSDDQYFLNTGNAPDGTANFVSTSLGSPSQGFGSQSLAVDLNNDGWKDLLIADVDVDIPNCGGSLDIYRNLGNAPNVTFQMQSIGGGLSMPTTHNVAAFDINNDGWKDLVIGTCSGTLVWRQVPPSGISFTYPDGLPAYLTPEQSTTFQVQLTGISGAQVVPDSGQIYSSIDGAPFTQQAMTPLGGNLYSATLPAADCTSRIRFYFSAEQANGGGTRFDPPNAPTDAYLAVAAIGTEISFEDAIEGSTASWSISDGPGLTAGTWQQATPNPTLFNNLLAAPTQDDTGGNENTQAFVTFNGPEGDFTAGAYDVDGGATMLVTPVIDLANADATIAYSRWFFASLGGNFLKTEVSNNNGTTWVTVDNVTATIADAAQNPPQTIWRQHSFIVGQYVAPTAQVQVRFTASGTNANAVVEAGIDNLRVEKILCEASCPADTNGSGAVDVDDLIAVILGWGPCGKSCPGDIDASGAVDVDDLIAVILGWGACP